jgi:hypothetical protein
MLLRAAFNLQTCDRDADPRVLAVLSEYEGVGKLAQARGLGPKMALAKRIVLFRMQSELHAKCHPDFETALRRMDQAVEQFRHQVEQLPDKAR